MISRTATRIALVLASLVAAGCSDDAAVDPAPAPKSIVACTSVPFEPAEFREDGELVGYDIDIMDAVAERLDRTLTWNEVEFDAILDELDDGACDVAIASIAMTDDRTERAAFVPYLTGTRDDPEAASPAEAAVPDPDAPPIGIASRSDEVDLHVDLQSAIGELYADGTMRDVLEQWDAAAFLLDPAPPAAAAG